MTNSCNQQFFFFFSLSLLPIEFPLFLSTTLLYTNLETFSYLPLMFLSNYINMQERKKLALFMCIAIFLSLSFLLSLSLSFVSLNSVGFYLILISLFIICVQMKEEEERKKKENFMTIYSSLFLFISSKLY